MNEDKATRYHRLKRRASLASLAWHVLLLTSLAGTGAAIHLRQMAQAAAGSDAPDRAATVAMSVMLLLVASEAGSLPIGFYGGFLLERRYGLSNQSLGGWLIDQVKGAALAGCLGIGAASVVYLFIRRDPSGWWWPAAVTFAIAVVGLASVAPVVLLPIFFRVKPLERQALRERLLGLATRAGARVVDVYELGLGAKTKKANAALAGWGRTRRILVSDTMLADYSDEEIEVVLAHELAHHVHGDIWKGMVFESVLMLAGCWVASRALLAAVVPLRLVSAADPAGLPVLLLAAGAVSLVMVPAAHALSRAHERSADRFALGLTRNPGAFVSAMRRLGAQNLAEERPAKVIEWLFYSHPPLADRIAAAQAFSANRG